MNDANADRELLLTHTAWIRGLARRLVEDPNLADDLAQDASVAALEHPEAAARSPRAWLGTVLRNRARETARRDERRGRRERVSAPPGAAPPTSDVVARAELHGAVVQAVLGLNEPYREIVLLRFFDGLPPRRIAKRLGVSVSTVHTRLTRAIDRLRVELDRRHDGDRTAWLRGVALLAAPPATLGTGATLVAGAAALVIGGAAAFLTRDEPATPHPAPEPEVAVAPIEPEEDDAAGPANSPPDVPPPPNEETPPSPPRPAAAAVAASAKPAPRTAPEPARPAPEPTPPPEVTPRARSRPPVDSDRLDALREAVAEYFRARFEEDYLAMARTYEKVAAFGDVAALPPADLRYVLSAPILPERSPRRGKLTERTTDVALAGGQVQTVDYVLSLPREYREGEPWPCVLLLPPSLDDVGALESWIGSAVPRDVRATAIVVAPRPSKTTQWFSDEGRRHAFFALADVYQHFDVDRGRLILDGAAASVDSFASDLPTLFAGVIRRGATGELEPTGNVAHLAKLDLGWAELGAPDDVDLARISSFVEGTVKRFAPRSIEWETPSLVQTNAYWLSLSHPDQEFDAQAPLKVAASIDRQRNTFYVAADPRVRGYTIYLNDAVVDLGRPVRVVHSTLLPDGRAADDARTVFEGKKERNLEFALGAWFLNLSGNLGEAYVASIEIEVE